MKRIYSYWWVIIPTIVYFILRCIYTQTIQFGFDQPRLAMMTLEFLKSPDYFSLQEYYIPTPWGNVPWGPSLILFYLPILAISSQPIIASLITAAINSLSVIITAYLGKRYFNKTVALFAGLLLATQPWWIIFSRMIYQPTPVPTLVALMMLCIALYLEKPRAYLIAAILILCAVLFQVYISTLSIILTAIAALLLHFRSLKIKPLICAAIGILILIIPSINYFTNNPKMFQAYFSVRDHFETEKKSALDYELNVFNLYVTVISGGGMKSELGYGFEDYFKSFPYYSQFVLAIETITIVLISFFIVSLTSGQTSQRRLRLFILIWATAPFWFISILHLPEIVPRYFLLALPALALLLAVSAHDFVQLLTTKKIIAYANFLPILILIGWSTITLYYYNFLSTYSYPQGILSPTSDPSYDSLQQTVSWILQDAERQGNKNISLSLDADNPNQFTLNDAFTYEWKYRRHRELGINEDEPIIYYFINTNSKEPIATPLSEVKNFGVYTVYQIANIEQDH